MAKPDAAAIVAFTRFPQSGAAERFVVMLGQALRRQRDDAQIHLLGASSLAKGPFPELEGLVTHWTHFPGISAPQHLSRVDRALARRAMVMRELFRLGASTRLRAVHFYNLGFDGVPLILTALRLGARVLSWYNDLRYLPPGADIRRFGVYLSYLLGDPLTFRLSDRVLVVSSALERFVRRRTPSARTSIIPAIVDVEKFRYDAQKAAHFRSSLQLGDRPLIGYFGSFRKIEGVHLLFDAIRLIRKKFPSAQLLLAGPLARGAEYDDIRKLTAGAEEGAARYLGLLDTDPLIAALSASDVLVVPKLYARANDMAFPTKLSEYFAAGRPTVVTDAGDVPLYARDHENALVVPPDAARIADAVIEILDNPAMGMALGSRARESAEEFFSFEAVGRMLARITYE